MVRCAWLLGILLTQNLSPAEEAERERVWDEKHSATAEKKADEIRQAAAKEARALGKDHPWAGTYRSSEIFETQLLVLAPSSGFVFERHGCVGVYDRNYGVVADDGDGLRVQPALPNTRRGLQGVPEELIPVPWGRQRFLVDASQLKKFCNAINSGGISYGAFFTRVEAADTFVPGPPQIPTRYENCLLAQPIRAKILGVAAPSWKRFHEDLFTLTTTVTIGAGRAEGIWAGMTFHTEKGDDSFFSAEVMSVGEHTAEARFEALAKNGERKLPDVNDWLSTVDRTWAGLAAR